MGAAPKAKAALAIVVGYLSLLAPVLQRPARADSVQYGLVSVGTSDDLGRHGVPYQTAFPLGKGPANLVGVAVSSILGQLCDKPYVSVFAFYDDLTYSEGVTNRLNAKSVLHKYKLPEGKKPSDIIDLAAKGATLYAWYKNGQVSRGTIPGRPTCQAMIDNWPLPASFDIDLSKKVYSFTTPPGLAPADVVGIAIDDSNSLVFAWYQNGTVSAGTTDQLGRTRAPKPFKTGAGKPVSAILGMSIDGGNHRVYGFYQ